MKKEDTLIFAQITDTHIVPTNKKWVSIESSIMANRLREVVQEINAFNPKPKFVIHTGDIVDYGDAEAYRLAKSILDELSMPYYIIPGNHDSRTELHQVFRQEHMYLKQNANFNYVLGEHAVNFVMLDTLVPQNSHGLIDDKTLGWMQMILDEDKERPAILCMHHFPCRVIHKLFNDIALRNADAFKEFLKERKQIIAILAGHYHVATNAMFAGKNCWISPSVAPTHYFDHADAETFSAVRMGLPSFTLHTYNTTDGLTSTAITVGANTPR